MENRIGSQLPRWALQTVGLAASYFIAGRLALLLAIPPGYAAPVWPAAGIALAWVLVCGYRIWPGVLLGSFLVNLSISLSAESALLSIGFATGASLQAVVGAYLVRRLVGFPASFTRVQDVLKIMVLGGPISCLISASLAIVLLHRADFLSSDLGSINWWTWWLGDSIGVLLVVPLLSAWQLDLAKVRGRVALPLAVAVALTITLFLGVRSGELRRTQLEFKERTDLLAHALDKTFASYIKVLYGIEGLFMASQQVERQEFRSFVRPLFSHLEGIKALEWSPRVFAGQRAAYEEQARRDGYPSFRIVEFGPGQRLIPAGERAEYFPVYFLEPYAGNEAALGFDLASNPVRLAALQQARDHGLPVASRGMSLVQESGSQDGVLVFLPVFSAGAGLQTEVDRRQFLQGFAVGVFRVEAMVKAAFAPLDRRGINYRIEDPLAPAGERLLYTGGLGADVHSGDMGSEVLLDFAGRHWLIRFAPTSSYLAEHPLWEARAVLLGGLLFSSLAGAFFLFIAGRTATIEATVRERTAELSQANADLAREMRERQESAKSLRLSEERFNLAVSGSSDGVWDWNILNDEVYCSPRLEELLGCHDHVFDTSMEALASRIHPEDLERALKAVKDHLKHHNLYSIEFRLRMESGEYRWFLARGQAIWDAMDRPVRMAGSLTDISVRKRAEEELHLANEKLQQVDRLKSMFIASMSHELRTPLNSIIGFSSILLNEWAGPLNDEQKENLATVARTGKHLLALINDVIDVSKIEAGQIDVHADAFDLHDVIDEAAQTLIGQAESQQLELRVENLHHSMDTDRLRLLQCILNLLSNAIKYSQQGTVSICAKLFQSETSARRFVEIAISDTGIGIPEEDRTKIFQPFVRLDSQLKSVKPGTGLGLYLTQKLVREVLQGEVGFESRYDEGSRFFLIIPDHLEEE